MSYHEFSIQHFSFFSIPIIKVSKGGNCTWPSLAALHCNGTRQSPINIVSGSATEDENLTEFTFEGYNSKSALERIENTGDTVKVTFTTGVKISGGGLSESYDSLQFHLHWGNGTAEPGSEHTVDGKRFPMELHIVNTKSTYSRNTTLAVKDSEGLAALGFLIEVSRHDVTFESFFHFLQLLYQRLSSLLKELTGVDDQPASWKTLTSYLTSDLSLDDLLSGVNRSNYYRYLGSLTTPVCNEAVVWTVFKEPIKRCRSSLQIDLFSSSVYIKNSTSLMVHVYRSTQPSQPVSTQPKASSSTKSGYSLALMTFALIMARY
uniref:Carbonic anhydrase n=1 Tax=Poecilia reticulata TaxID=8081 RepID=A0A3P9QJH1_POERE